VKLREARIAHDERERRVATLNQRIAEKARAYSEIKKDAEHAERYGQHRNSSGSWVQPGPASRADIERMREHEAKLAGDVTELQRQLAEITGPTAA
jgi:hypothetical protein